MYVYSPEDSYIFKGRKKPNTKYTISVFGVFFGLYKKKLKQYKQCVKQSASRTAYQHCRASHGNKKQKIQGFQIISIDQSRQYSSLGASANISCLVSRLSTSPSNEGRLVQGSMHT